MMIQVSYISSVPHPMNTDELVVLLQTCLANNQRLGVTGMLLYGNETFLQTLEGDEETVDSLYEKIANDPRHSNVRALSRTTIESRRYSDWNMGFKRIADEDLSHVDGLIDFTEKKFSFKYLAGHAEDARALMDHFSSWDPLLRKIEEKDDIVSQLKTMLAHARGCVEIATLVLEGIAVAGKAGPLGDEHLRLCDVALSALRQIPDLQAQADAGLAAHS